MLLLLVLVPFSENLNKMAQSRHCSENQHTLIKTLIGEEEMYKEEQKTRLLS